MSISHSSPLTPAAEEAVVSLGNGRTTTTSRTDGTTVTPIVVDLGKKKRKQIRALKRGSGKLMDEVGEVLNRVRDSLGSEADLKNLVPVVVIYRQKDSKRRGGLLPFSL
jgi:Family of unknown function (DUF6200)